MKYKLIGSNLQSDSGAETYVLNEIQSSLQEMTGNLDLDKLGLPTTPF